MNLEHALTVEGWLTELEAEYLASVASRSQMIAEVGSWMGRSTCAIAANTTGKVYAVDTWEGSKEHAGMLAARPAGWLKAQFLSNMERYGNVLPIQKDSLKAAWLIDESRLRFDMIFLDASHDYENVAADIKAWTPLLAEGGILCGHDYQPPYWPGVTKAVKELVPKFRVVPNTSIWTTEGE